MFLTETLPIQSRDRLTATETALYGLEPAVFGGAATTNSSADVAPQGLNTPSNVVVTQGGTAGSTDYTYVVADVGNVGVAPTSGTQTTAGYTGVNSTNYNIITWSAIPNHTYNVYRSATSSGTVTSTGLIGTVGPVALGVYSAALNDTGQTATGNANAPTVNTTGCLAPAGPIFGAGLITHGANIPTLSTAGNAIWLVSQMLNHILIRNNNTAAISDTTPSAAALIDANPGCKVNSGFWLVVRNACTSSGVLTMVGGTNLTLANGNTNTIAVGHAKICFIQFTNVTAGSESATLYTVADSAF